MVFTRVFSLEYWGKRKLCLVSCHGCHIHGTWRTKEVRLGERGGRVLKSFEGTIFYWGELTSRDMTS